MNNIQKTFKAKAKFGLRMAVGGLIDPNGSDYDAINAEKTARWAAEDAAKQGLRGPSTGYQAYSGDPALRSRTTAQPAVAAAQPAVAAAQPAPAATQPALTPPAVSQAAPTQPAVPGFGKDEFSAERDARQARMESLSASLKPLTLAEGGIIEKETPDQIMARMAAKYGAPSAGPAQAPAPQPAPAPAPMAAPQPKPGFFGGLRQALDPERRMKAAGLEAGGIVRGKGGVDNVPMTIAGKPVNLTGGDEPEAVLPSKTVQALGGPAAVEKLIEATNGKPPSKEGLRAGGHYGGGTVNIGGRIIELADDTPRLPPPQTGTAVAVRPSVNVGGAEAGSIPGQATRVPTPQTPPAAKAPMTKMQMLGKAAPVAAVASNLYDAATDEDPAEQVSAGLKAGLTAAPVTRPVGMGLTMGDAMLKSATGYSLGQGLDKLASLHPDYMRDKVDANGNSLSSIPMDQRKTEATKAPTPTPVAANTDTEEAMRDSTMAGLGAGTPQRDKSMDYMRGMGVDTSAFRAPVNDVNTINGNGPEKQRGGAVNTINTANGAVYTGRDAKGQLVVTSGLDRSDADQAAATKSGYEQAVAQAEKDKQSLRSMQRDRYTRDMGADITDPSVIAAARENLGRMDKEDAVTSAAAQRKEELGLRREMLGVQTEQLRQQDRQFNQTLAQRKEASIATAREKGVTDMVSMLEKSGYKDKDQIDFMDFVNQNHADNLSGLSHAEQLKVLPRLKADFEDMKVRNANSTNGTSWQNGKRVATDKLDYEKDAAIDPTGIVDNKIWFGDGSDGKGLGKANIFARKNLPSVVFGSDDVDVMENGQRIMRKDNRGARGPQGSIDMREINRLSLRDANK